MLSSLIRQELIINIKSSGNLAQSLVFLLITASIFAFTTNIDNTATSVAIIWVCLTFAILLGCNQQFQQDFDDGTLEQLYLSGYVFELIILTKIFANWLFNTLPLIIFLPIIALILKIPENLILDLITVAIIASLIINFLVSFGTSLTLSTNSTSSLLIILILPLTIPTIIFANAGLTNDFGAAIKLLLGLLIFLIPILTFATSAAIKINVVD